MDDQKPKATLIKKTKDDDSKQKKIKIVLKKKPTVQLNVAKKARPESQSQSQSPQKNTTRSASPKTTQKPFKGRERPSFPKKERPPFNSDKKPPTAGASKPPVSPPREPKRFVKKQSSRQFMRPKYTEKELRPKKAPTVVRKNPVPSLIEISEHIVVSELAKKMNLKASDLIKKLMGMGMRVTINHQVDAETAEILASEYNSKIKVVADFEEEVIAEEEVDAEDMHHRPPIITVMGHVDHGKTTLLDYLRNSNIAEGEAGAITQHIGAYQVSTEKGIITCIDTPGHEAFTLMRARGAQVTDIVILVVAADDGVMPQTIEALNYAQDAKVPIIVAITKIDLPQQNLEKIKNDLSTHNLIPEEWGGQTMLMPISAKTGEGVSELLNAIILQAEILELKARTKGRSDGIVLESTIDPGLGRLSTILVQQGTLSVGDSFVVGSSYGRVRMMIDDRSAKVKHAGPSSVVQVFGFNSIPEPGDHFQVSPTERLAKQISEQRQMRKRRDTLQGKNTKVSLDSLYESIQESEHLELKIIIKADTQGSVEALQSSLKKLSNDTVRITIVHAGAGAINETDVMAASVANAILIGFHVSASGKLQSLAEKEGVTILRFNIIYEVIERIDAAMKGMVAPELYETITGKIEVRDTFKIPKIGLIAGCFVLEGTASVNSLIRIYRNNVEIHSGKISSMKRMKNDVKEVQSGYECGIGIERFSDIQLGDIYEAYEVKERPSQ